jgi:hypothetical protein
VRSSRAVLRPWVFLVTGLCAVGLLVGLIAWGTSAPSPLPPRARPSAPSASSEARAALQGIAAESARWMPDELRGVYLGMSLASLRAARPAMREGRGSRADAPLWEETLDQGARVVAQVAPRAQVLVKVQVLSRLEDVAALRGHFEAMRARYGDPTGFWDCPERADASPVRRITWRGERVTLTEAILVYGGGASVTLVVSGNDDVARALAASACAPLTPETLARWPVARVLRGERVEVMDVR